MFVQKQPFTLTDLHALESLPENQGRRFELYAGRVIEVPPSFEPSTIAIQIASALNVYVQKHKLGYVTGADGGYIMTENTRFIPDVGFIQSKRLPDKPVRDVPVPPDFAVEVVSPSDTQISVHRKAMKYIEYGTSLVWVAYPDDKTVHIYTPAEQGVNVQIAGRDDTLTGGDVLPEFKLSLADVFIV